MSFLSNFNKKLFSNIIILPVFLLFITAPLYSQGFDEKKINAIVDKFFNCLKKCDQKGIKRYIHQDVIFKDMTRQELLALGEKMFAEEVSISDYMISITGHNIYQFVKLNYKLLNYKIQKEVKIEEIGSKDEKIKGKLFYMKVLIVYEMDKKIIKKRAEIDIIEDEGKEGFKILGFII
ncbi:MAG: hypothetical protein JW827_11365 [Spirochaetes bacterium]|nr:hypothetical protein [Spirochaetota bacterium]